jgi:hypothetical protein
MTNDTDEELLAAANQLVAETKAKFDRLLHGGSGRPRAEASLADVERAIREAVEVLTEWLRACEGSGAEDDSLEEMHRRELDRRQPDA